MKIAKASTEYIVLSNEIFLVQHNEAVLLNRASNKLKMRRKKILTNEDGDLGSSYLDISALMDKFDYKSTKKLLFGMYAVISSHNKYAWNNTYD